MPDATVTFELTVDGGGEFQVLSFAAREKLSAGFVLNVTAVGPEGVDLDAVVGTAASLIVARGDGHARRFHGVVRDVSVESPHPGTFRVHLEIAARVDRLRIGQNCRIFQEKSVPDIVRKVLVDAGVPADAQAWNLSATYAPRDYVVQYNESDWDFAARLLESEGIGFLVRHGENNEQVVLFDDDQSWLAAEGSTTVLVDRDATQLSADVAWDVREVRRAAVGAVALRDQDYRRPTVDLNVTEASEGGAAREVYDHPGVFAEVAAGRRLARRRLERLRVGSATVEGKSDCAFLEPGRTFSLEQSARTALDAEYVVWECEHHGRAVNESGATTVLYENRFVALARATVFRPTAGVAVPVAGPMLAFVTTAPGEEILTDEWGRAKVRFPWDRSGLTDQRSSTWLRVGQLALGGSMILPRGNYEVLVDAERSELDRPFVAGHLYNAEAMPPYALPAGATRSSMQSATFQGGPGSNEMRFEDSAGAEEIFVNASKDLTELTDHDATWHVSNNETVVVGANRSLKVGSNRRSSVTADRTLTVDGNLTLDATGTLTESTGGGETVSVGGMRMGKVGGDLVEDTAGSLTRTVGSLQCVTGLTGVARTITGSFTNTVAGAWAQMSGGGTATNCAGSRTEMTGALKMIKAKTMSVECGAAYTENVASMSVKAGGSRTDEAAGAVTITAGGGLSVKANVINIEAKNRLVVMAGGCMIQLSSGGSVKVRAVNIDLRGAKGINQVTHSSN